MKRKFSCLLLIIFLSSYLDLYSQETNSKLRISIEFGSMNSTITNNYKPLSFWGNISNEEKSKSGITTGVGVEYILSDHFYLQSGLNFSSLESGTTIYNTDETSANWQEVPCRYDSETEYKIVSLPIGLRYNFLQLKKTENIHIHRNTV